jgi:hypothetical protein
MGIHRPEHFRWRAGCRKMANDRRKPFHAFNDIRFIMHSFISEVPQKMCDLEKVLKGGLRVREGEEKVLKPLLDLEWVTHDR